MEDYQASIRAARENLQAVGERILLLKVYTNYLLQAKREALAFVERQTSAELRLQARETWARQGEAFSIDCRTEERLERMARLIAEKTSRVVQIKRQLAKMGRRAGGARSEASARLPGPAAAAALVKRSLYKQTALKTLPLLNNVALTRSLRICNEGETLVVVYKQKLEEYDRLAARLAEINKKIEAEQFSFRREALALARGTAREEETLRATEKRRSELQTQALRTQRQMELAEDLNRVRVLADQERKMSALAAEKAGVEAEIADAEEKIRRVYATNRNLFDTVGDKVDEIVAQFDAAEAAGLGARRAQ